MRNMFKRSLASVMAVASLAVGMVGMSASAASYSTSTTGSSDYGDCYYYLSLDEDNNYYNYGSCTSYSTVTRYCTVSIYLASSVTATPAKDSKVTANGNLVPNNNGTTLCVTKHQRATGSYKYCYKANLYGGAQGPYVPVVETKYLSLS